MTTGGFQASDDDRLLGRSSTFVLAAHELKSPLALMRQLALQIETGELTESEVLTTVRQLRWVSERALRTTVNVTQAATLQQLTLEVEPVNIVELCEDVAHELTPMYRAAGRSITVKRCRQSPLAVANRDLLRRILLGYGDNALHYAGDKPAVFQVSRRGDTVRTGLRDGGPVIQNATTTGRSMRVPGRPESSGLGLEIATQFAALMGGQSGVTRHRRGMTYYVDVMQSTQLGLL